MNTIKTKIAQYRKQSILGFVVVFVLMLFAMPSSAQSVSISIAPEDLDVFFNWFNIMFGVVLPIALLSAGLAAGVGFAFTVGRLLLQSFSRLISGGK